MLFRSRLPYSLNIQLHNYANLSDGSQLDNGFAGALKAPGFYCSGYREVNGTLQKAGNRQAAYLFVTGLDNARNESKNKEEVIIPDKNKTI